jgi:NadR type nicotinamide-nucleotide adenylyltransferase
MEKTKNQCIRIAIIGPESTGKSTLAVKLAEHFKAICIPEFARTYLENKTEKYSQSDIDFIAQKSLEIAETTEEKHLGFIFYDTDLLVCKVWSEFVFGSSSDWLQKATKRQHFHHTFLMNIDLPWQEDPLREHPFQRKELFEIYKQELIQLNRPFSIISGLEQQRENSAIHAIHQHFSNQD